MVLREFVKERVKKGGGGGGGLMSEYVVEVTIHHKSVSP